MNTTQEHNGDYEMMARILSGDMAAEEKAAALEAIHADPGKLSLFNELSKYWDMMETKNRQTGVDTDKAWENLSSRLAADGLLTETRYTEKRKAFVPVWMRWAASLLLLAVAGTLLYTGLRTGADQNLLSINSSADKQTLVQFLQDGSVVYLAENTQLAYPTKFTARQRKVSLEGEAFFDVTRDASQPFIIETEPAIVEVLGTSFNVRSTGEYDFELYVEEGKVRVSTRKKPSERMDVEAGETLFFTDNRFIKVRAGDNSASEWKTNRMHFKDETLENILMVINRNFGSRLEVVPEASQRRLTVTFYQSTLPTIIELISLSMNLQTEEKEGSVIEFKPGA